METSLIALQETIRKTLDDRHFTTGWEMSREILKEAVASRRKILIAGNGGSAAEAQHFSAELVGRYKRERGGYPAIALTTDTSILTAVGNDYGYDAVFARQVEALGEAGDILVLISSSGNSKNCIEALICAKERGLRTIILSGRDGGAMQGLGDAELIVPSEDTARIQEVHLLVVHAWCEYIEAMLS